MKGLLGSSTGNNAAKAPAVDTLIGRQTEVLGDVRFSGGLHLDGKVKGTVQAVGEKPATLSVSESGTIEGDVNAPNIILNGTVIGDVRSTERLSLAGKARVTGNVYYKVLEMEPGAIIVGQMMFETGNTLKALPQPKPEQEKGEPLVLGLPDARRAGRT